MSNKFKIIYTSDVHGQLLSTNYVTKQKSMKGLSRFSTFLNKLDGEYICLDNGDFLQGSPLLDYSRTTSSKELEPIVLAMNHIDYNYITIGNHDYNYGSTYLNKVLDQLKPKVLCANIINQKGENIYQQYAIHKTLGGLTVGIIGAVTHYIPNWEKPSNIKDLTFTNAYHTIERLAPIVKKKCDVLVVLYHGGFEKDLDTGSNIGRPTEENQGYLISKLADVDILLSGHQHVPLNKKIDNKIIMQTANLASDFGFIEIDYSFQNNKSIIKRIDSKLMPMSYLEDKAFCSLLETAEQKTQLWLDQVIGKTNMSLIIKDSFKDRCYKHPMFQLINNLQLEVSNAQISAASLPNECPGFSKTITRREVAANFIYPNTLVKLKITGKTLKLALEKTAEYFKLENGILAVSDHFIYPKVEHYNYDIYDGIDYKIKVSNPFGKRIEDLEFQGSSIKGTDEFTLVLNNYRAIGGGDYDMFKGATVLAEYDVSLLELATSLIEKDNELLFSITNNFVIVRP